MKTISNKPVAPELPPWVALARGASRVNCFVRKNQYLIQYGQSPVHATVILAHIGYYRVKVKPTHETYFYTSTSSIAWVAVQSVIVPEHVAYAITAA